MRQRNFPKKGKKYNEWTVLGTTEKRQGNWYIECQCSCGFKNFIYLNALRNNKTKMCKSCTTSERHKSGAFKPRRADNGILDIEPIHLVSVRIGRQHQGRLVNLYKGTDGVEYTIGTVAIAKSAAQDTLRKRIEIYGPFSPVVFWPGRIPKRVHEKNRLFNKKDAMPKIMKTRNGKHIPELTAFERTMIMKPVEEIKRRSMFSRPKKVKKERKLTTNELKGLLASYNAKKGVKTSEFISMEGYSPVYAGD